MGLELIARSFDLQEKVGNQPELSVRPKVSNVASSFVAVRRNGMSNDAPIWIQKLIETISDNDGNVCTLGVYWYNTRTQTCPMSGAYHPCFNSAIRSHRVAHHGKIKSVQTPLL